MYQHSRLRRPLAVSGIVLFSIFAGACGGGDGGGPDTTPPDTRITASPNAVSNSTDARFEFTSTENNSTFEISLDGAAFASASTPLQLTGLSAGRHMFEVRATDAAGNTDASPASFTWTVDLTPVGSTPQIVVSACTPVAGDSTQNPDGSASFVRSHTLGSPLYKIVTTRQYPVTDINGTVYADASMDYMVHEPIGTPKGIIVLIAGGGLTAFIEGSGDGVSAPINSGGNFLVRSAHRYQDNGYRVITIDRPSDGNRFGSANVDLDAYRNSMLHAVDLATIIKRENNEGLNVIISGTSRGGISAAAMNTLATAVALSSPITSGGGQPVGSAMLPLSRFERASHILLHTQDACQVTLPAGSRMLFDDLVAAGNDVSGDEVDGGFRDTMRNNVCGAFDFHGFLGIETCAVGQETDWADGVLNALGNNVPPQANNQSVNQGDAIILSATDADGDTLSYAVPFANSVLGGEVATDTDGNVTYISPVGVSATTDSFAFTVTDGNGGVGRAVVTITLPQL